MNVGKLPLEEAVQARLAVIRVLEEAVFGYVL